MPSVFVFFDALAGVVVPLVCLFVAFVDSAFAVALLAVLFDIVATFVPALVL